VCGAIGAKITHLLNHFSDIRCQKKIENFLLDSRLYAQMISSVPNELIV